MVNTAIVDPVSPAAPLEVILGRMYGQPIFDMPKDLYIPPDALEVILDAFEGPLDLLLYLIRKANINVLDIPMVPLTAQYLEYVEAMRQHNLELAADYLLMAATDSPGLNGISKRSGFLSQKRSWNVCRA